MSLVIDPCSAEVPDLRNARSHPKYRQTIYGRLIMRRSLGSDRSGLMLCFRN